MRQLIYLDDAIDAIEHRLAEPAYQHTGEDWYTGMNCAESELYDLPSVQTEQRWVSCSERMPEEREWIGTKKFGTTISDEVYVTFESPDGVRFAKHLSFQNEKLSNHDQLTIDAFHKGAVPIAWMPLPEPAKRERI